MGIRKLLTNAKSSTGDLLADSLNVDEDTPEVLAELGDLGQLGIAERGGSELGEVTHVGVKAVHVDADGHERLVDLGDSLVGGSALNENIYSSC